MSLPRVYNIEPNPHWVIIDNFSKLPNGAAIYTYRSLNPTEFKPAFQDQAGMIPYGQPIVGFGNGTMPPIFWEFDPNNPNELYYIRVYDSDDPNTQQFLWDFNNLSGAGGGSGGSVITTALDLENLITNGVWFDNCGNIAGSLSVPTFVTLAPSNHIGFVGNAANVSGSPAPDIVFEKNNTTASDSISFIDFSPLGANTLAPDITPVQYFEYACTVGGSGETYKHVQFPILAKVQNLSQQTMTIVIYARCTAGNNQLDLYWRQFYGDGGGSSEQDVLITSLNLTSSWQRYLVQTIVPDATGQTLGACGNDALFLQCRFPLSPSITTMDIVSPAVYLGAIAPTIDINTYDNISSIGNSPRTGDVRTSLNNQQLGWVQMNDGTIGNATSGGTTRANIDTFALYSLIWNNFSMTPALAPIYTSAGAASTYGASAIDDFTANKRLSLTRNLGRVMAGANPVAVSEAFTNTGNVMTILSTSSFYTGVPVVVSGGSLPTPLVAGTTYYVIQLSSTTLSLATTPENAIATTAIVLTTNASGTVTVPAHILGTFLGEEDTTLSVANLAPHTHTIPGLIEEYCAGGGSSTYNTTGPPGTTATSSTGSGTPFSVLQPTVYMNVFMKL